MKIKIRIALDRRDFTVYQDIKINRILILQAFLTHFTDVSIIKVSKPVRIAGYLGLITKL